MVYLNLPKAIVAGSVMTGYEKVIDGSSWTKSAECGAMVGGSVLITDLAFDNFIPMTARLASVLGNYSEDIVSALVYAVIAKLAKGKGYGKSQGMFKDFLKSFGVIVMAEWIEEPAMNLVPDSVKSMLMIPPSSRDSSVVASGGPTNVNSNSI